MAEPLTDEVPLDFQREAAQTLYPREWAATLNLPGEKRRRRQAALRKRAIADLIVRALPPHATCGNCASRGRRVLHDKVVCLVDSDFYGEQHVDIDGRRHCWSPRADGR